MRADQSKPRNGAVHEDMLFSSNLLASEGIISPIVASQETTLFTVTS
jgi:hypothetical protein